ESSRRVGRSGRRERSSYGRQQREQIVLEQTFRFFDDTSELVVAAIDDERRHLLDVLSGDQIGRFLFVAIERVEGDGEIFAVLRFQLVDDFQKLRHLAQAVRTPGAEVDLDAIVLEDL